MERTIKLIANGGSEIASIQVSADKHLPDVVLWGVNERQKAFIRDKGDTYREASWIWITSNDRRAY